MRIFAGGCFVLILTLLVGNQNYNGTGINIIEQCIDGTVRPEAFYSVNLRCGDFAAVSEKFKEKAEADALAAACAGQPVTVKAVQRTEKTENAPQLYDLTALDPLADYCRYIQYCLYPTKDPATGEVFAYVVGFFCCRVGAYRNPMVLSIYCRAGACSGRDRIMLYSSVTSTNFLLTLACTSI